MSKKLIFLIIVVLFTLNDLCTNHLKACTAFCIKSDSHVLVGKNLDWPIGVGIMIMNPRNIEKMIKTKYSEFKWCSKYGSVTFNQFGLDHPLGGMNETGLVVEELSYSPTVYPINISNKTMNEFQWIQYQLDNFRSVAEVITNLEDIQIDKMLFGLHYLITDSDGNSAVIEFINGNIIFYCDKNLSYPVLTNDEYGRSIKNLKKFKGFGGAIEIREMLDSQSRFVRTSNFLRIIEYNIQNDYSEYAFNILKKIEQKDTQWSIVYDITKKEIIYLTKDTAHTNKISFCDIEFENRNILFKEIRSSKNIRKKLNEEFIPLDLTRISNLVDNVMSELKTNDIVNENVSTAIKNRLINYAKSQRNFLREIIK